MQTSSQRMDELENHIASYNTNPLTIGYQQSLFGYNSLKWDRRIEPVRFREAKKSYAETLELIASKTCELFFELATAQANLDIAQSNYASADTLYRYARGRYNIGSITSEQAERGNQHDEGADRGGGRDADLPFVLGHP